MPVEDGPMSGEGGSSERDRFIVLSGVCFILIFKTGTEFSQEFNAVEKIPTALESSTSLRFFKAVEIFSNEVEIFQSG